MADNSIFLIEKKEGNLVGGVQVFFEKLLSVEGVDALFLPMGREEGDSIMPTLVTDPKELIRAVPFSPAFPVNSGRMASRISYRSSGRQTAVFMRPCEHRAFVELVKLKQGNREELILVGTDCCGALTWKDYGEYSAGDPLDSEAFVNQMFGGDTPLLESDLKGFFFSMACQTCENSFPVNTDINFILHGADLSRGILVQGVTEKGAAILKTMDLPRADLPGCREERTGALQEARARANKDMTAKITEKTDTMAKLDSFLSRCINCYNCRNLCPVCYCKECVFNTDVFSHQPVQYLQWAEKKGRVKLPTDTLFYHLTRMAHMSHACVGCGQCSNACPSDISVFELFKSVGALTQAAFDYCPGTDETQSPPLSVFYEKEFEDVVGV